MPYETKEEVIVIPLEYYTLLAQKNEVFKHCRIIDYDKCCYCWQKTGSFFKDDCIIKIEWLFYS